MGRLVGLLVAGLLLLGVCAVCFVVTVVRLARVAGWRRGLLGVVCPAYAFVWGWGRGRCSTGWMGAWTLATALASLDFVLVDLSMG
jgi:hypothetical protein